ncbi:MAG: VWA domain-containing protein [Methylococcales bacterium]
MYKNKYNQSNWKSVCDPNLLPFILEQKSGKQRRWPVAAVSLGGIIAIFALAGPSWERISIPVFQNQSALVIVLDLSRSMDTTDVKPSRLIRARYKIADILESRKDGQNALIVFAGESFVVTPLTDDGATILNQLSALDTSLMPSQGGNVATALTKAKNLFQQAGLNRGKIILITDEVSLDRDIKVVKRMKSGNFNISILGVGTPEGAPIAVPNGGFLKDSGGNIIIPRLNVQALKRMANAGGGIYRTLSTNSSDIEALLAEMKPWTSSGSKASDSGQLEQWEDGGFWLVLALLPLGLLVFRKGYLIIPVCILVSSPEAQAFEWKNLWNTPDQQAANAYKKGQLEQAAKQFENQNWRGAAQYSSGQYQQAVETLENETTSDGLYNKGNALAKSGQYQEAISAYQKALEINPQNEDAKYNRTVVEKQLEKQQQSQSSDSKPSEDQEQSEQQKDQDQESSDQQPSDHNQRSSQQSESAENKKSSPEEGEDKDGADPSEHDSDRSEQQNVQESDDDMKKSDVSESDKQSATPQSEAEQTGLKQDAVEQWLRRIPDDPGGLLRRKFQLQYKQRKNRSTSNEQSW